MTGGFPDTIHTVTFDCWSTLLYEAPAASGSGQRQTGEQRRGSLLAASLGLDQATASAAFAQAWRLHQEAWHRRLSFASFAMLEHTLHALGVTLSQAQHADILRLLEDEILAREVRAIEGARELLAELRGRGVRTALICDTGFTPGRVVRQLLERVGLLRWLEVSVFSDEIGVTKPDSRAFERALSSLGVSPQGAVHVGDLRRSDVAGARAAGMASVRFCGHHDDHTQATGSGAGVIDCVAAGCTPPCARPEADQVVATYTALSALLRPRLSAAR